MGATRKVTHSRRYQISDHFLSALGGNINVGSNELNCMASVGRNKSINSVKNFNAKSSSRRVKAGCCSTRNETIAAQRIVILVQAKMSTTINKELYCTEALFKSIALGP